MFRTVLSLLSLGLVAGFAFGQDLPNKSSLSLDEKSAWIVNTTKVMRQLKLEPDQKAKVDAAFASYGQSENAIFAHGAATEIQLDSLDHALATRVLASLNSTQRERLHQLALQVSGPYILADHAVAEELQLTPSQKMKIDAIVQASSLRDQDLENQESKYFLSHPHQTQSQQNHIFKSLAPQRLAVDRQKRADATSILKLLTPLQMKKWSSMIGDRML